MGAIENRVFIVTGASSGIGLATVEAAIREGAKVLGVDIAPLPERLQLGDQLQFLQQDLTDPIAAKAIVERCQSSFGVRIDALLNIAGVIDHFGSVDTVTDSDLDRCMAINVTAPIRLMREIVPIMKQQKSGVIVNLSSRAGMSGAAGGLAYTASKHAIIGVTKNVAWRFKKDNIRCNVVCPGGVATGILNSVDQSKFDQEAFMTIQPLTRTVISNGPQDATIMIPEDIAHTIIHLCSDSSSRISGAVIPIDDAWSTI